VAEELTHWTAAQFMNAADEVGDVCYGQPPSEGTLENFAAMLRQAAETERHCDPAGTDAMRLLEQIATIIDGPMADTRLHDWSGLPERTRLRLGAARILLASIDAWCEDIDQTPAIEFICETLRPQVVAMFPDPPDMEEPR
jgi:hypothetical protein